MKLIKLNESQYQRLFELDSFVATGGNEEDVNPITDYQTRDEVVNTSKIKNDNEVGDSNPVTTDTKQGMMSPDGPYQRPGRGGGY